VRADRLKRWPLAWNPADAGAEPAGGSEPAPRREGPGERAAGRGLTGGLGRSGGWLLPASLLSLVFLAVGFSPTLRSLWSSWRNNANYSHGFLVPPIVAFLVWRMRARLAELPVRSSWMGIGALLGAVALQIVGLRGDVVIFQGYAIILALAGLVWAWFGWRYLRQLAFPLAFLLFMVPFLPIFMNQVSFRLKVVAANGSVWLAQALGVTVTQRGMELFFPTGALTIENACSGLNSLISLMALGALFAHLGRGRLWRRWVLFACAIPIAIVANTVRITSLCLMAAVTNTTTASGLFHDIGGIVLFGIAFLLLGAVKRGLRC
jgi:exosortase